MYVPLKSHRCRLLSTSIRLLARKEKSNHSVLALVSFTLQEYHKYQIISPTVLILLKAGTFSGQVVYRSVSSAQRSSLLEHPLAVRILIDEGRTQGFFPDQHLLFPTAFAFLNLVNFFHPRHLNYSVGHFAQPLLLHHLQFVSLILFRFWSSFDLSLEHGTPAFGLPQQALLACGEDIKTFEPKNASVRSGLGVMSPNPRFLQFL